MDLCLGSLGHLLLVCSFHFLVAFELEAHASLSAVVGISGTLEIQLIPEVAKLSQLTKVCHLNGPTSGVKQLFVFLMRGRSFG